MKKRRVLFLGFILLASLLLCSIISAVDETIECSGNYILVGACGEKGVAPENGGKCTSCKIKTFCDDDDNWHYRLCTKPDNTCTVGCPCTSFTYSDWSECINEVQTRTVLTKTPAGCIGGSPVLNQSCSAIANTCIDGDGGIDFTVRAQIQVKNSQGTIISSDWDDCEEEFYCEDGEAKVTFPVCPNGCENGACITTTPTVTCTDSDGGLNYDVKGKIDWTDENGNMQTTWDRCPEIDDPNYGVLQEMSCTEDGLSAGTGYYCHNGCSDGACLPASTSTCTDSDGGKDYYEKGEIIDPQHNADYWDTCLDESTLREYYCGPDNYLYYSFTCPDICYNGACSTVTDPQLPQVCQDLIENMKNAKNWIPSLGDFILTNSDNYHNSASSSFDSGYTTYSAQYETEKTNRRLMIVTIVLDDNSINIANSDFIKEMKDDALWSKNIYKDSNGKLFTGYKIEDDSFYALVWFNENVLTYILEEGEQEESPTEDLSEFISKLSNNKWEYADEKTLQPSSEFGSFVEKIIDLCPSKVSERCWPSWRYKLEPIICPEYGRQTSIWNDVNKCYPDKKQESSCSPGICSGCYVPRYSGSNGNNICIPYGFRALFQAGEYLDINMPDVVSEFEKDGIIMVMNSDNSLTITLNNTLPFNFTANGILYGKEGDTKIVYSGEKYEMGFEEFSEGPIQKYVFVIDNIRYSEDINQQFIKIRLIDSFNAYCDIDGRMKQQKLRDYNGNWAKCQNNYECESNFCNYGECSDPRAMIEELNIFKKVFVKTICKLSNLFNEPEDYNTCLAEYLGGIPSVPESSSGGGGGGGGSSSSP